MQTSYGAMHTNQSCANWCLVLWASLEGNEDRKEAFVLFLDLISLIEGVTYLMYTILKDDYASKYIWLSNGSIIDIFP